MRACAPASGAWRDAMAVAVGAFYGACDVVLSPSPAADRGAGRDRHPPRAHPALGPGRGHRRFDPALREPTLRIDALNVLYCGAHHPREGRRAARRRLPARARARAPAAAAARRRRARAGAPARAPRRERHLPRLARGRRARPRLRERRHLPVPERHRHLRPGDPRGTGQRPARRRRRRGRAAVADRGPRQRAAAARPTASELAAALLELADSPLLRERLARAGLPASASAPGSGPWSVWERATSGWFRRRPAQTTWTRWTWTQPISVRRPPEDGCEELSPVQVPSSQATIPAGTAISPSVSRKLRVATTPRP